MTSMTMEIGHSPTASCTAWWMAGRIGCPQARTRVVQGVERRNTRAVGTWGMGAVFREPRRLASGVDHTPLVR